MADINNPPPPAPPQLFPPLPEGFQIPAGLVQQWLALPWDKVIEPKLARQEWEFLFFGMTKMILAQNALQDCLVKWSNGDTPGANMAMDTGRRTAIEADNQIRQFFMALMTSAVFK